MRTADAAEEWIGGRLERAEITEASAEVQRTRLRTLVAVEPLADRIDRRTLLRWQAAIGHMAPATRRSYQCTVFYFCRWLADEGRLAEDPNRGLARVKEPRRVPRALQKSDVGRILQACRDERTRAMVWLMVGCGLRRGEVAGLDIHDYDEIAGTIGIVGKGGHERVLPVPAEAASALSDYFDVRGRKGGALFLPAKRCSRWNEDGHISPERVGKIVSRAMTRAGVHKQPHDGRTAHALRHTAASDVLDKCGNVRVVQEMLGHTSLVTTQIYLRRADLGRLREAMEGRNYALA